MGTKKMSPQGTEGTPEPHTHVQEMSVMSAPPSLCWRSFVSWESFSGMVLQGYWSCQTQSLWCFWADAPAENV